MRDGAGANVGGWFLALENMGSQKSHAQQGWWVVVCRMDAHYMPLWSKKEKGFLKSICTQGPQGSCL